MSVSSARTDLPHYLPAALIGGFGIPDPREPGGRYAKVCMRRRGNPDAVLGPLRAEKVAAQFGLYDVDRPDPDLPADFAETMWQTYEGALPRAIAALEAGEFGREEWSAVLLHIQAQSVRHPDFDRVARDHLARANGVVADRDLVQRQRLITYRESRALMAKARYALVCRGKGADRYLLNDKGYVSLQDVALGVQGLLFPLTGNVAVLLAVFEAVPGDDYEAGPLTRRVLNARGMAVVNGAAWEQDHITCVFGHPDDATWIGALGNRERSFKMPDLGPYRDSREPGLLDWALTPDQVRQRHLRYARSQRSRA